MNGVNGTGSREHTAKGVVVWWCVRCLGRFTPPGRADHPNPYQARLALRSRARFGACPNCRAWARAHLHALQLEGARSAGDRR